MAAAKTTTIASVDKALGVVEYLLGLEAGGGKIGRAGQQGWRDRHRRPGSAR